jgi:hypothetical protein
LKADSQSGAATVIFVAGIKYASIFTAGNETGISGVAMHKALKKSKKEPCKIKKNIVVLEAWVLKRLDSMWAAA